LFVLDSTKIDDLELLFLTFGEFRWI